MSLVRGARLGPYEVTDQIGVGGMGEVYRATDTKLKRQVALKVLPASVAGDADRLARFQREAEVLASLNHPNIAAIHGLEDADGTKALVMELVEGPTLADRIAQGALPLDEALAIAKQIAEALEAAHEQGIIHRDLKPANIKVRPDGTVKVLDFGLAKAMAPPSGAHHAQLSQAPTITTPAMTQAGIILGTAAYMSPEQARGSSVDRRSDLWSFGAILYEMLTGRRAFTGDTVSDTLASVLAREPDWGALAPTVPPGVWKLLRRCLEKDRRKRLDSAAAVRLDLEDVGTTPGVGDPPVQSFGTTTGTRATRLVWSLRAVAAIAVVLAFLLALQSFREDALPETRVDIITPSTADPTSFAVAPDGRHIVYVAVGSGGAPHLWLRTLDSTSTQELQGTEGATAPFWSPDSRSVAFFGGSQLKRLDLDGGAPRTLAAVTGARGGTWSVDGVILFAPSASVPLSRISASGGDVERVTTLNRQSSHRYPTFLPDGRRFVFFAQGDAETNGIFMGSLDDQATYRLTASDVAPVYLPPGRTSLIDRAISSISGGRRGDGWLLWARQGTLVAQRLAADGASLTASPITLAEGVSEDVLRNRSAVTASASGLVAYRTGASAQRQLAWFDRSGTPRGVLGDIDDSLAHPRLSPDGSRVAVYRTTQGNMDLWLLDGQRRNRLTFDQARDGFHAWSPDGRMIAFSSLRNGVYDIYQKPTSGSGTEEPLVATAQSKFLTDWSADGRFLLYMSIDPLTNSDIWVRPMMGDLAPRVFLKTRFIERWAQFSPDGRFIAYESNESGRNEIYVRPFAATTDEASSTLGAGQWQVSTSGGIYPKWRADGKELYFLSPAGQMMGAPIVVDPTGLVPGVPVALFPTQIVGGGDDLGPGRQYDVSRDGRFLINTVVDKAPAPITLLQNWNPAARR